MKITDYKSVIMQAQQIRRDGGTQARLQLNLQVLEEYEQLVRETPGAWPFNDPVVIFYDGSEYWLADGFHRVQACVNADRFEIEADVRPGTRRDAQLYAAGANAAHGLRRTADDKRRAVLMLLNDDEWRQWSDREIARRCNVSNQFVSNLRKRVTVNVDSDNARTYTTKHGTVATMNVAAIGSSNGSQAAVAAVVEEDEESHTAVSQQPRDQSVKRLVDCFAEDAPKDAANYSANIQAVIADARALSRNEKKYVLDFMKNMASDEYETPAQRALWGSLAGMVDYWSK